MAEGHPFILSSKDETASTFHSSFLPLLPCCGLSNFATHREAQEKGLMDCSICTSMPVILRPPRNTICGACYEGARSIINLINKLESEKARNGPPNSCKASSKFMFLIVA